MIMIQTTCCQIYYTRLLGDLSSRWGPGSTLRRHLDSVEPETPMQDIIDRCVCGKVRRSLGIIGETAPPRDSPFLSVRLTMRGQRMAEPG